MEFSYAYQGNTAVDNSAAGTALSFEPDLTRQPTYFRGELRHGLAFREAISALHQVVVSDLRFTPRDTSAYKAWAAQREQQDWEALRAQAGAQSRDVVTRIQTLQTELRDLNHRHQQRLAPFYKARQRYFDYLYKRDYDAWFVLDPVITVHPDEVFFECFSQDESSYGRLGVDYEVFENIGEMACGTTNIDYSQSLYNEFQKIRSYKTTRFEIDPGGFQVQTGRDDTYRELKIDLPDSWVRGFLQVSSAMSLPMVRFTLHPMDIHNLCLLLRRHRERHGPRSLRYHLTPGQPVRMVLEPWNRELICHRSLYQGDTPQEIRVWGRRRLHILERLIPIARSFTVCLLGSGMPSFYIADLGKLWFTLGLSGWTANDWSRSGNFDLLAPRGQVDQFTVRRVFQALKDDWCNTPDALSARLGLDRATVLAALGLHTQAGRAIYDLNKGVYRCRELSREPLPLMQLRFSSPQEFGARILLEQGAVKLTTRQELPGGGLRLQGSVKDHNNTYRPELTVDADQRLVQADCGCSWYRQNKLYKGPCEHMLALRLYHARH